MIKVDILETDVFNSLSPDAVDAYLRANRWQELRRLPNDVVILFSRGNNGEVHRIWLPLDQRLSDYAQMMGRVVSVIALQEDKSQLQVLDDLSTVAIGDVVRMSTYDTTDRLSSTISFADGQDLIDHARSMTLAAARSAVESRAVYLARYSQQVGEFMEKMRLGQTEHGSYTIKLISPITKPPEEPSPTLPDTHGRIPFERRAIMKLVSGLKGAQEAAQEVLNRGRFHSQPFLEQVPRGVSANLLDSITLRGPDGSYRPVGITVTWSTVLADTAEIDHADFEFPVDVMPYFVQASQYFRETNPDHLSIEGFVKVLRRDPGATDGEVELWCKIDNRPRTVRIELQGSDYQLAIRAHEEGIIATAVGDIEEHGNRLRLINLQNFAFGATQTGLFDR